MITRRRFALFTGCFLSGSIASKLGVGCVSVPLANFSLTVFKYGQSTLPESWAYQNGSKSRRVPISFLFYMIDTGKRKILVDAGCDSMPGFEMEHFITPVKLLHRYGLSPDDITDVVITHAHHDHIGGVAHFKKANIYIQKDEARLGAKYLKGMRVQTFDECYKINDFIEIKKIAGHSIGSSIVIIHHQDKPIVLAGDECYVRKCLDEKIPTGVSCDLKRSEEFIRTYSSNEYDVLLYHDFSILPNQNGALCLRGTPLCRTGL